jgi:hypothetical protein
MRFPNIQKSLHFLLLPFRVITQTFNKTAGNLSSTKANNENSYFERVSLHIAFWLAYLTEDITLIYLWDKDLNKGISTSHQLMMAVLNSLSSLIPKLLFVYYVLYYNLPKLLSSKRERKKYIAQLLLALIVTTFLYRAITIFYQSPIIYKDHYL